MFNWVVSAHGQGPVASLQLAVSVDTHDAHSVHALCAALFASLCEIDGPFLTWRSSLSVARIVSTILVSGFKQVGI